MSYTRQEVIIYAIIFIVIAAAVAIYASSVLSNQAISVSVKLVRLNATPTIYPYQLSKFRIYVNNTGISQISGLVIETYVNSGELQTFTVKLPPKTSTAINFSYDSYPVNGTYVFQAVADPGHLLNLPNRSTSSSSYSVTVSPPQVPDVYTSIPNVGVKATQHFSFLQTGLESALYLSSQFGGETLFNQLTNNNSKILTSMFKSFLASRVINATVGAYAEYDDSSVAYTAWIQGAVNLSYVYAIASTFSAPEKNLTVNGVKTFYMKLSNKTSFCAKYDRGWTKLFEYTNSSQSPGQTCLSITSTTYNSTLTRITLAALTNDTVLGEYYYRNSTPLGFSVTDANTFGAMEMIGNKYGVFTSYVTQNPSSLNLSAINSTCNGTVTIGANNASVCTRELHPLNSSNVFILLNSTAYTKNHTFTMYSLTNYSTIAGADQSAANLLAYINVSGVFQWKSPDYFACAFNDTSLPCSGANLTINSTTGNAIATINLHNSLSNFIKLNNVGCTLGAFTENTTINTVIPAGSNATVQFSCMASSLSGLVLPSYTLDLNYSINNIVHNVNGTLNEYA